MTLTALHHPDSNFIFYSVKTFYLLFTAKGLLFPIAFPFQEIAKLCTNTKAAT